MSTSQTISTAKFQYGARIGSSSGSGGIIAPIRSHLLWNDVLHLTLSRFGVTMNIFRRDNIKFTNLSCPSSLWVFKCVIPKKRNTLGGIWLTFCFLASILSYKNVYRNKRKKSLELADWWTNWLTEVFPLCRLRYGHLLPAVRKAFPDPDGSAAAHGGARRCPQLHLQWVQPDLPQPHCTQAAPTLTHR